MALTTQDRIEITALRGSFADAANRRDHDQFAALFTDDGAWEIPDMQAAFSGRVAIRDGIERMLGMWEVFVQTTHDGTMDGAGARATGRAYINEIGRFRAGGSQLNYALYDDIYARTEAGWRFERRTYHFLYVDETPLQGRAVPYPPATVTP
jgi:ketosteroid isomerase-like protein